MEFAPTRRQIVVGTTALLGVAGLVWIGSAWYGAAFVRAVYAGEILPYLGRLLRIHQANNPAHQGLSFYIELVEGAGRRLFVLTALFWGIVLLFVRRRPSVLQDYFSEASSPLTLAVFRIVVFVLLLYAIDVPAIVESARKVSGVRYAPALMGWLFNHVPLGEMWVRGGARLMQGACLCALVGVFTRPAAWIAGGLGVYVLGIPELLGKINHGHHVLIWFALLLGAAPAGDALSVDALVRAWRNPGEAPPEASSRYGRPLRWAWLLIAVIYFFPGFWKFMLSGLDWMLSGNLKFKMYAKWHQLQWIPALRIDRIPVLYQGLAIFTVVFELFFGVAILVRRLRPLAVLSGFGFHLGVAYFMRIVFYTLMWGYVVFVPWGSLLRRAGRFLFPTPLTVRYPATASWLRRLVAVVRTSDWLRRVHYRESERPDLRGLEAELGGTVWRGSSAIGSLLLRVPLVWPIAPVLALGFAVGMPTVGRETETDPSRRSTRWMVSVTGGALLGINVLFGLFLINSWPFSVYPTHAGVSGRYMTGVDLDLRTVTGDTLEAEPLLGLSASRRRGLMRQVLSAPDPGSRRREIERLTQLLAARIPDSTEAETAYVYREKRSKVPKQWETNPVDRSLLLAIPLSDSSEATLRDEGDPPWKDRGRRDVIDLHNFE